MASLRERLLSRIAIEDAEIARIQTDAQTNLAAAHRRRQILQMAFDKLDAEPQTEQLLNLLAEAGVKVVE